MTQPSPNRDTVLPSVTWNVNRNRDTVLPGVTWNVIRNHNAVLQV